MATTRRQYKAGCIGGVLIMMLGVALSVVGLVIGGGVGALLGFFVVFVGLSIAIAAGLAGWWHYG